MVTTMLDWAAPRGIGFSKIVSLGDKADVDFGDLLDYLAMDADTRAILLYAESIAHARKFMSAARIAARSEEHTSELQSLMRISYAVFCLKKKKKIDNKSKKVHATLTSPITD